MTSAAFGFLLPLNRLRICSTSCFGVSPQLLPASDRTLRESPSWILAIVSSLSYASLAVANPVNYAVAALSSIMLFLGVALRT